MLAELHLAALNRAKKEEKISVDLLARLAVTKFLRTEMNLQFAQVLERCRVLLKTYDGMRQGKGVEYRERVAGFQVRKKIILRKTGQDLFETLREIEKETLARTRRSFFGEVKTAESNSADAKQEPGSAGLGSYGLVREPAGILRRWPRRLFVRRTLRDARQLGSRSRPLWALAGRGLGFRAIALRRRDQQRDHRLPGCALRKMPAPWLAPERPMIPRRKGCRKQERLAQWVRLLEDEQVMEHVIASYHTVPLLTEYAPRINPQQLKNALISRPECDRVERMIQEHGKLSPASLYAAVAKVAGCRGAERAKVAARFLQDFSHYHRDLRRLEVLNAALDSVNLVSTEKLRELSRMNGTLYEFLLPDEQPQQPEEDRVLRHVVLKADVRDSTRLTRTLMEKGTQSGFVLQPELLRSGEQAAEQVWSAESFPRRRCHHSGYPRARRRTWTRGEPDLRAGARDH